MINRICQWFADRMTPCHIPRDSGEYMRRYFTTPTQEEANWFLHNICRPDHEDEPHNHPYRWQCSIVLAGSYDEETWDVHTGVVTTRRRRFFNWIPGDKYHIITKLHGDVWTIFFHGKKHGRSWGFWVPGVGHVHNEKLAEVKAELDKAYWTEKLAPTRYEGEIESGDAGTFSDTDRTTDPVHYLHKTSSLGEPPGWYYYNEVWCDRHGPFNNAWECRQALLKYCKDVLGV